MEKLMQYVWQYRLIPSVKLTTVEGERISIINPGMINTDAGPDFFNADIKINGQQWVGNIEIHVRASDWFRHGHDKDPAYDSVILHIVEYDDAPIHRSNGEIIPQMVLKCSPDLHIHYNSLVATSPAELPCSAHLRSIPDIYMSDWLTSLAYQRLQQKADNLVSIAEFMNGDWISAGYVTFARALGFGKNSDPFERLAKSTPLRFLNRHADSMTATESILFGQAGFLTKNDESNRYYTQLKRDYQFYSTKFGLKPIPSLGWKMSKMRPQNFPHRRIAYLAALVRKGITSPYGYERGLSLDKLRERLNINLGGFWSKHYTFNSAETPFDINLSRSSLDLLIINAVIPMLYAWGQHCKDQDLIDQATDYLFELKPENNMLVRMFTDKMIKCPDAFTSQGIIQLRKNYCEQRQCLNCRIGHRILTTAAIRY